MGWVLITVIAIIAAFTIIGKIRGFMSVVVGFASMALAIVGAAILTEPVGGFLADNTGLKTTISEKVVTFVDDEIAEAKKTAMKAAGVTDAKKLNPEEFKKTVDQLPLPDSVKTIITDAAKTDVTAAGHTAAVAAAEKLASTIVRGIAFVICFVLIIAGLIALRVVLKIVQKLPVIHGVNGLLGAGLGFIEGVIAVWVFFAVVTAVAGQPWAQDALVQIGENKLLSILYVINPIFKLL